MGCGKDMLIYIQMETWFSQLAIVTTKKIGSLLKLTGSALQLRFPLINQLDYINSLFNTIKMTIQTIPTKKYENHYTGHILDFMPSINS